MARPHCAQAFPAAALGRKNAQMFTFGRKRFAAERASIVRRCPQWYRTASTYFVATAKKDRSRSLTSKIGSRQIGQSSTFSRIDGFSCRYSSTTFEARWSSSSSSRSVSFSLMACLNFSSGSGTGGLVIGGKLFSSSSTCSCRSSISLPSRSIFSSTVSSRSSSLSSSLQVSPCCGCGYSRRVLYLCNLPGYLSTIRT